MTKSRKLYISSNGPEAEPVKKGFFWLLETAVRAGSDGAYLVTLSLGNLEGAISEALGEDLVKLLERDKSVTVVLEGASVNLDLLTERIDSGSIHKGPALVIYPNAKMLERVDDHDEITDVLVVPWIMEDIQEWIETWNAQELGMEHKQVDEPAFSDPVVEAALKSLTIRVNLSTGLGHPSDRDTAIWLFRNLKRENIRYNPIEIKGWLVRHGWSARHANKVKEVAEKIQNGKRLRTYHEDDMWIENIVEIWREEALKP